MENNKFYGNLDAIEGCHSINLSLEASSTQSIQMNLYSLTLHLLFVLPLEKKKKKHTIRVPLIKTDILGNLYLNKVF